MINEIIYINMFIYLLEAFTLVRCTNTRSEYQLKEKYENANEK